MEKIIVLLDDINKSSVDRLKDLLDVAQTALDRGLNHFTTSIIEYVFGKLHFNKSLTEPNNYNSNLSLLDNERTILLRALQMYSIAAFYTDDKQYGFLASDLLLLLKNNPVGVDKNMIFQNQKFYVSFLNFDSKYKVPCKMPLINDKIKKNYRPMNPSIIPFHLISDTASTSKTALNGYLTICRGVNYDQEKAHNFTILDDDHVVRTRNFLLELNDKFETMNQREIINKSDLQLHPGNIQGMEDCQLIYFRKQYWVLCTMLTIESRRICRMVIGRLKLDKDMVIVDKLIPLKGPDSNRNEKNWVPFVYFNFSLSIDMMKGQQWTPTTLDDALDIYKEQPSKEKIDPIAIKADEELRIVYNYSSTVIYKIEFNDQNLPTGNITKVSDQVPDGDFSRFRGSGGPILTVDEKLKMNVYILIIHEAVYRPNDGRHYFHRFIKMDSNFKIIGVSLPFCFDHLGIEFCRSMCVSVDGHSLILAVGIEDREANLYMIKRTKVMDMIKPLILL